MIHEMKGAGETVMIGGEARGGPVELARFGDGSWGIRKRGVAIGVWEPHERGECLRVFNMLAGVSGPEGRRMAASGDEDVEGVDGRWN